MDMSSLETQFKNSINYTDLVNLLKNNFTFIPYKFYIYNIEHHSSQIEIGLKIIFNFINQFNKEDVNDIILDKFNTIKTIINEICDNPKDNKKLAEDICSAINSVIYAYINYTIPEKYLSIEEYLDYEFSITSSQYKIHNINEIISYGLWREELNYGKLLHSNKNIKTIPYPYSTFMKILLSRKYLNLRNKLTKLAYKLLQSIDTDISNSTEISNDFIKSLETFVNKQFIYINDKNSDVFGELRIYIENIFINVLDKSFKKYTIENLEDIPKIKNILKTIDFWDNTKEDIFNKNIQLKIFSNYKKLLPKE